MDKRIIGTFLLASVLLNFGSTPSLCTAAAASKKAPGFTLRDLSGKEITLSQFKDKKALLLVFGATWCPYCINEIPELKEIYNNYTEQGIELLYIDIQESHRKVSSFVEKHSIPYTVLLDTDGTVAGRYNVRGIPHQVIIDKKGMIFYEGTRPRNGLPSMLDKLIK